MSALSLISYLPHVPRGPEQQFSPKHCTSLTTLARIICNAMGASAHAQGRVCTETCTETWLALMWRPSSRRGGKTTMLQPFPQPQLERWRESTQHQPDQGLPWACAGKLRLPCVSWPLFVTVGDLLVDVWSGATPHNQLTSLKKVYTYMIRSI